METNELLMYAIGAVLIGLSLFVIITVFLFFIKKILNTYGLCRCACPKCKNALIEIGNWDGDRGGGAVLRCSKCAEIYVSSGKGLEVCNDEMARWFNKQ